MERREAIKMMVTGSTALATLNGDALTTIGQETPSNWMDKPFETETLPIDKTWEWKVDYDPERIWKCFITELKNLVVLHKDSYTSGQPFYHDVIHDGNGEVYTNREGFPEIYHEFCSVHDGVTMERTSLCPCNPDALEMMNSLLHARGYQVRIQQRPRYILRFPIDEFREWVIECHEKNCLTGVCLAPNKRNLVVGTQDTIHRHWNMNLVVGTQDTIHRQWNMIFEPMIRTPYRHNTPYWSKFYLLPDRKQFGGSIDAFGGADYIVRLQSCAPDYMIL